MTCAADGALRTMPCAGVPWEHLFSPSKTPEISLLPQWDLSATEPKQEFHFLPSPLKHQTISASDSPWKPSPNKQLTAHLPV